jgi:hypothetical protein
MMRVRGWSAGWAVLSLAVVACARTDAAAHDSALADSVRVAKAADTLAAPRVVPYNPAAPGAMRSGDAPIRAATTPGVDSITPAPSPVTKVPPPPVTKPARLEAEPPASADSVGDPVAIVRGYYAAIRAHDYLRAYRMWQASGQSGARSFAQFEAGFDSTESVEARTGAPGRVEGAAGSRFITVPVEIDARLRNGTRQRFTGTFTLRRVVVPGASAAERRWHLYASNIRQVQ